MTAVDPLFEGPELPGPEGDRAIVARALADQPLDATVALPPPTVPGGELPLPALAKLAAAASVPVDAVDAEVAAVPPSVAPPVIVPPPATPAEAAQRNAADARAIGEESVAAVEDKAAADVALAEEKARFQIAHDEALGKLQERQEAHRIEAERLVTKARSNAENEPYHTYFETRGIGARILHGIGIILQGVSWNPNHVNRGLEILQNAMHEDMELQKAKHADLWRSVEAAEKGLSTLDSHQLREVSAFSAREGAKWDAVAGRLNASIAAQKGKGDVTTAKKAALEANEKATAAWQNSINAAASAEHMRTIDAETKRHHEEQEKTSALRAAKYKTRGGGTGGAGRGKMEQAAITLGDEIQAAKLAGKPMSTPDIDRRAVALGIPIVGKANTINARQIIADAQKAAETESKGEARDLKIREADEARTVRWNGKEYLAPRASQVKDIAKDIANMEKYTDLIHEVSAHIKKHGFIIDPGGEHAPQREIAKERMTLMAEVQALGRQISALQATDAGQKLEHQMIGAAGVGLKPGTASPHVLNELAARAQKLINTKLGAMLTPKTKEGEKAPASGKIVAPPPGSKFGKLSNGDPVAKYPDGTYHRPDGSEVIVL